MSFWPRHTPDHTGFVLIPLESIDLEMQQTPNIPKICCFVVVASRCSLKELGLISTFDASIQDQPTYPLRTRPCCRIEWLQLSLLMSNSNDLGNLWSHFFHRIVVNAPTQFTCKAGHFAFWDLSKGYFEAERREVSDFLRLGWNLGPRPCEPLQSYRPH